MALFAKALFTATDGTLLSAYTPEVGTIAKHPSFAAAAPSITSNRAHCSATDSVQAWYFTDAPPNADYTVTGRIYVASALGQAALHARFSSSVFTGYSVQWLSGTWTLYRWNAGTPTSLATFNQTLNVAETHTVTLQAVTSGSTVYCYVTINGAAAITYADTSGSRITATGTAGFNWFQNGSASGSVGLHLDSIEAGIDGETFTMDNASVYLTPLNWKLSGSTYAQSNTPGAYFKTKFTGTSLKILVDPLPLGAASVTALNYPKVIAVVDGVRQSFVQLNSAATMLTVAEGLSDTEHEVTLYFAGIYWNSNDRWTTPSMVLRITGLVVETGKTISAPTTFPKTLLAYCDSNGEGWEAIAEGVTVANMDASRAFPILLAALMESEVSVVAFAGQGYQTSVVTANVPDLVDAWDDFWSGSSRLTTGAFTSQPNMILCFHGQNDSGDVTADVEALIDAWRAAAPSAFIAMCVPPEQGHVSQIEDGVAAAADSKAKVIDIDEDVIGNPSYTNNVHLSLAGHVYYADEIFAVLQVQFPGFFGRIPVFMHHYAQQGIA